MFLKVILVYFIIGCLLSMFLSTHGMRLESRGIIRFVSLILVIIISPVLLLSAFYKNSY